MIFVNVLLVYPNYRPDPLIYGESEEVYRHFSNCEPLGLEYLAASIKDLCNRVDIVDMRFDSRSLEDIMTHTQPEIVGLTGYSMHVAQMLNYSREIKKINPSVKTIAGGIHATFQPEDFFNGSIDYIFSGSNIAGFRELVLQLSEGKDKEVKLSDVIFRAGDEYRKSKGDASTEAARSNIPERALTHNYRQDYSMLGMKPIALMRTSYGCPFRCSFCSLWGLHQGKYHVHAIEEVLEDISSIKEKNIHFVDDEPWLNPDRMSSLAKEIKIAGLKKNFLLYARIDTLLERTDVIEQWLDCGLEKVILGVEAVTEKELQEYGKKITLSQIEKAYRLLDSIGLDSVSLFIARPEWKEKDFTRLKRFIVRHQVPNPMFTVLTPLPGTEMLHDGFGDITSIGAGGRPDWYQWDLQHPVVETALPRNKFIAEYKKLRVVKF